jgi:phosphopantetheinyl transferase
MLDGACSGTEQDIIRGEAANSPEAKWPTRLWAAKQAAGKALGSGANGGPHEFEAIDWEHNGQFLIVHHPTRNRFVVATHLDNGNVITVTSNADSWSGSNRKLEYEFAK